MKIKMKRSLAAILALVIIFSLAACGEKVKESNEDDDKAETIVLGKCTAVFKGYTLTKDDEGNDAMVLTYDYTNGGNGMSCPPICLSQYNSSSPVICPPMESLMWTRTVICVASLLKSAAMTVPSCCGRQTRMRMDSFCTQDGDIAGTIWNETLLYD